MKYFLIFCFFFASLFAQEDDQYLPFSDVERGLPTLVGDCVNVITGDYIESDRDLIVKGPLPLSFERFYSSADYNTHSLFWGWRHNQDSSIISLDKYLAYIERSGRSGIYQNGKFVPEKSGKGYTNCGFGAISARNNIKNTTLSYQTISYIPFQRGIHALSGSGTLREFTNGSINKEVQPNGNEIIYEYKGGHLSQIKSQSPNSVFSQLDIEFNEDPKHIESRMVVGSNDGREVIYHLTKFRERTAKEKKHHLERFYHISKVERTDGPTVEYQYNKVKTVDNEHISKRSLPDHRNRWISYYEEGPYRNRVKCIASPVGTNEKPVITHTFHYSPTLTNVYDAYHNRTCYCIDCNHRLKKLVRFLDESPYSSERYKWNEDGELLEHSFERYRGETVKTRSFQYDQYGNILSETLKGNITGAGAGTDESYSKHYTYSKEHLLLDEKEDNGREIRYTYDKKQRLHTKEIVFGSEVLKRHTYKYDENSVLIEERTMGGGVTFIKSITPTKKHPIGLPEVIEEKALDGKKEVLISKIIRRYSKTGRLIEEEHYDSANKHRYSLKWEYDAHGNVTSETNALGESINRLYDANDNLIVEEFQTHRKEYTYDFSNRCIKESIVSEDSEDVQQTTSYSYNYLNQRVVAVDHFGNETRYVYDSLGRLIETIYPTGHSVKQEYDLLNNVVLCTDQKGNATKKEYNIHGQPLRIEYPDGTVEVFVYNLDGSVRQEIGRNGLTTTYTRDVLNRVIKEEKGGQGGQGGQDGQGSQIKTYTYDAFHKTSETDAEGVTTYFTYDCRGKLRSRLKAGTLTSYEYDTLGRLCKIIEGGVVTVKEYDLLDRVNEERLEDVKGKIFRKVQFAYDSNGNRTHEIRYDGQTVIAYDAVGRPVKITDPLGQVTRYIYKCEPNLVIKIDPDGVKTITTKNALNQESLIEKFDPMGGLISKKEIEYDPVGNICLQRERVSQDKVTETKWVYNCMNELQELVEAVNSPDQKKTIYKYNDFGKKESVIKADGTVLSYKYDDLGRLIGLTSSDNTVAYSYTYNGNDQVIKVDDLIHDSETVREYDSHGRVVREKLGNGLSISRDYDGHGRMISTKLPDDSSVVYEYDPVNLKKITRFSAQGDERYSQEQSSDLNGNIISKRLPGKAGDVTFVYDPMKRNLRITHPAFRQTAKYNKSGNLTQLNVNGESKSFAYDYLNQLIKEPGHTYVYDSYYNRTAKDGIEYIVGDLNQVKDDGKVKYKYDACGRLIRKTSLGEKIDFTYDALDRLIKVVKGNEEYLYVYDSYDRRLMKNGDYYLYDDQVEIGRVDLNTKHLIECRIVAPQTSAVAIEKGERVLAVISDTSGNILALINTQTGKVVEEYDYTAFGEEETVGQTSPWRYQGKRVDPETALVYFGKRFYNPQIGKWITKDPMGSIDSTNLYQYVFNNPNRYTDPTGEMVFAIPLLVWGAEIALAKITFDVVCVTIAAAAATYAVHEGVRVFNQWSYWNDNPLPTSLDGVPIPSSDAPHTQIGSCEGSKGKYTQGREFDGYGKWVKDIDFTDHGRPQNHTNPHEHKYKENPTGGSPKRGDPEPLEGWNYEGC